MLPLVLPPVVMGYLLLITFGTRAPIGGWLYETFGIRFIFSWTGAGAGGGDRDPFRSRVRAIRLAIEASDRGLEAAARTLGAGRLDVFFSVTLPLMLPGIVAGAITAFAASLGEFGAIITFVSNVPGETRTLPLAIYTAIQTPGGDALAARLAGLSIALALTGLVLSEVAARRVRRITGLGLAATGRPLSLSVEVTVVQGGAKFHFAFEAPAGGLTALAGPSGAGKTTAIDLIAGMRRPSKGRNRAGRPRVLRQRKSHRPAAGAQAGRLRLSGRQAVPASEGPRQPALRLAPARAGAEDRGDAGGRPAGPRRPARSPAVDPVGGRAPAAWRWDARC